MQYACDMNMCNLCPKSNSKMSNFENEINIILQKIKIDALDKLFELINEKSSLVDDTYKTAKNNLFFNCKEFISIFKDVHELISIQIQLQT
jgi:hypothetical protein